MRITLRVAVALLAVTGAVRGARADGHDNAGQPAATTQRASALLDELTVSSDPQDPGRRPLDLSPENLGLLSRAGAVMPAFGSTRDAVPPDVTVFSPNGGESLAAEGLTQITWTATDSDGIAFVDVFVSYDGGASFEPVALGLSGVRRLNWYPPNRPTTNAVVRVQATDNALNVGHDDSDAAFTILAVPGGILPTTLRDFDQPGTQPFEHGVDLRDPANNCAGCHGNYDPAAEPYFVWRGSMMANASRDPLFEACLTIANQDAPSSGDLCIRCHTPKAWMNGRSTPTDGSQVLATDMDGVSCDVCHRMVDPIFDAIENPSIDQSILAALGNPASEFGNGMITLDPDGTRRGPFSDVTPMHSVLVSPFHQESAFCGSCHDVSNPALERDGNGNYVPNAVDAPATNFSPHHLMPIERTYSEWLNSAYNSPGGVYAPQFGGNKDFVSTCQDCHMRDITGAGCAFTGPRTDMPLHDLTGGSTWLPGLFPILFPGDVDATAQQAAIARARYMLASAATLTAAIESDGLRVRVTNETGHKLPTGYPEGRRMWLNVQYNLGEGVAAESGAYDPATGVLTHDPEVKIYEAELGIDNALASSTGLAEGPSFHFVLNNKVYKDNRIPPRGFTNTAFDQFGGAPVGQVYDDGQYWDDSHYALPACADSVTVTLYYQSTSREYVEFLRDENQTDGKGLAMYNLWNDNDKCPPEPMATVTLPMPDCNANTIADLCESMALAGGDFDADGDIDHDDHAALIECLAGPGADPTPVDAACAWTCNAAFDADGDNDVDLDDYAAFQRNIN